LADIATVKPAGLGAKPLTSHADKPISPSGPGKGKSHSFKLAVEFAEGKAPV